MKIIDAGIIARFKPVGFTCPNCECEFVADQPDEVLTVDMSDDTFTQLVNFSICPMCHNKVSTVIVRSKNMKEAKTK